MKLIQHMIMNYFFEDVTVKRMILPKSLGFNVEQILTVLTSLYDVNEFNTNERIKVIARNVETRHRSFHNGKMHDRILNNIE